MAQGKLIVLNGTSSSGKTSIARAMQAKRNEPLLYLALDTAISIMPFAYTGSGPLAHEGYRLNQTSRGGEPFVEYSIGKHALFMNNNLASIAASFCSAGYDVVFDHIITDDATMTGLAKRVDPRSAFIIAVKCDQETAKLRERERGDRLVGLVAGQTETVHRGLRYYDLIVDSSHSSPNDLAELILTFVNGSSPTAFSQIATAR
jgi:chloramphenicol 3-O phosphotransferase